MRKFSSLEGLLAETLFLGLSKLTWVWGWRLRIAKVIDGLFFSSSDLGRWLLRDLGRKAWIPIYGINSGLFPPPGLSGYAKVLCPQSAALIGQL